MEAVEGGGEKWGKEKAKGILNGMFVVVGFFAGYS